MVLTRPPMGWNSWNTFEDRVSEALIRETADAMVSSGLRDAGYEYVVIDDGWSARERDEKGFLVPDPEKFPRGIAPLADYVHSKGLKLGIYSCAGGLTCGGYPGSFDHEFRDAETFASWGVDFLKYDYCFHSPVLEGKVLYRRMGAALENCGRDIVFSACTWGADRSEEWIKETGASLWRSTNDIHDEWENVKSLIRQQYPLFRFNGHGCFNDMDMLVVGIRGEGTHIGEGMNDTQYRTHFSIWSLFSSPLMIGCDVRKMSEETASILLNREVIALNQDEAARQVMMLKKDFRLDADVFVRSLKDGHFAFGLLNLEDRDNRCVFGIDQLGLNPATGKTLEMRNLWTGETFTVRNGIVKRALKPCECELWIGTVRDI